MLKYVSKKGPSLREIRVLSVARNYRLIFRILDSFDLSTKIPKSTKRNTREFSVRSYAMFL